MTDGITSANGHWPTAESARSAWHDPQGTSGYDAGPWEESTLASDSGKASAWPMRQSRWQPPRPPQPPPRSGAVSPAGWFQPTGGDAAPPFRHGREPARSDETAEPPRYAQAPFLAAGSAKALRGRADGFRWSAPPGAVNGLLDPQQRSGWQLAQQVWQRSGVSWEPADPVPASPVDREPDPGSGGSGAGGFDTGGSGAGGSGTGGFCTEESGTGESGTDDPGTDPPEGLEEGWAKPTRQDCAWQGPARRDATRQDRGATGPVTRPSPGGSEYPPNGYPARSWPSGEADALFRAWQGSVRQAASPRRGWSVPRPGSVTRHRRGVWRAVTIGVPAAIIVIVGAGALMMLTGKANEMLAIRGDTANPATSASAAGGSSTAGGSSAAGGSNDGAAGGSRVSAVALPGYPGQHGQVAADSVWPGNGASLAVGGADGHPAIWRQAGGSWALVPAAALAAVPGTGNLTAVAHGPAGWLAVGLTVKGGSAAPLVLASADGVTWQPVTALADAAGPGAEFLGVAAGPAGYAVVGRQVAAGRVFAVLWRSADLRRWVQGGNGGLDGRLTASTANAVAATVAGFVAVGSHGTLAAIWTSPDGVHWSLRTPGLPSGARGATLRQVAARGNTLVATGVAATAAGDIPLAVVSTDGGAQWRPVILPVAGGLGAVTALTVEGSTLVAAGLTGGGQPGGPGTQQVVTWTSRDGLRWSAATAVAGVRQLSALAAAGGTLTGTGTGTGTGSAHAGADPAIVIQVSSAGRR